MITVLVTGASGLLGRNLQGLQNTDYNWIYLSSKDGDLRNHNETNHIFELHKPDYVFHFAANVGGLFKNIQYPVEMFHDNVLINENVLWACHKFAVKKVIALASSCVFTPNPVAYPMKEDTIMDGVPHETNASYSWAKRLMVLQAENYRRQYGMNIVMVNPVNLYGPYDSFDLENSHVIPALVQKFVRAKRRGDASVTVFGTGQPLRQFLYAEDLARVCILLLKTPTTYTSINCASDEDTIKARIDTIARTLEFTGEIVYDTTRSDGCFRKTVSSERFQTLFPDFTFTSFETGIAKTIQWFEGQI